MLPSEADAHCIRCSKTQSFAFSRFDFIHPWTAPVTAEFCLTLTAPLSFCWALVQILSLSLICSLSRFDWKMCESVFTIKSLLCGAE